MHLNFLAVADTLSKSVEPAAQTLSDVSLLLLPFIPWWFDMLSNHKRSSSLVAL